MIGDFIGSCGVVEVKCSCVCVCVGWDACCIEVIYRVAFPYVDLFIVV